MEELGLGTIGMAATLFATALVTIQKLADVLLALIKKRTGFAAAPKAHEQELLKEIRTGNKLLQKMVTQNEELVNVHCGDQALTDNGGKKWYCQAESLFSVLIEKIEKVTEKLP